jgi:phage tail-like protein
MPQGVPSSHARDALHARNFTLELDGVQIAQFSEVSGINSEVEVTQIKENTPDGKFVLQQVMGAPKATQFVIKRFLNASDDLWKWHKAARDGKLKEARKNGAFTANDYEGQEVARWSFTDAWCSKLTTSALKAGSNEVATEEATVVAGTLERVK